MYREEKNIQKMNSAIETRRKSRSKTPFLRSNCDNDACAHAGEEGHIHEKRKSPYVKKHPKVIAIIEEANNKQQQNIVENTRQKSSAITTSDYSSNSSEDLNTEQVASVPCSSGITAGRNKITTTTTVITQQTHNISHKNNSNNNWNENSGTIASTSRQQPTIERQMTKEIGQNQINTEFENSKIRTSTPIYNNQHTKKKTGMNLDTSPAYQEYKDAGEYWAKFPKTDYTYSKLSPHRREVVPGVIGMPNMSRKSLEKHHERINYMIDRNPEQETFIRSRYETKYQKNNKTSNEQINAVNHLLYDSQDEVDIQFDRNQSKINSLTNEMSSKHTMYSEQTWITKMMSFIAIIFYRFCSIFTRNNNENDLYSTRIKQERGDNFANIRNALARAITSIFSYFYLLISSVLYLDTLFLKSSSPDNLNKKRFLLLLLILLPLLLLAGAYYHTHPNEPFPPVNFSKYTEKLITVNLTQITQFVDYENIDQIKANTIERIDNLRAWSEDYFDYLKTVSYNVAIETQKMLMENFSN